MQKLEIKLNKSTTIESLDIGDDVHFLNNQIDRYNHITNTHDHPEMGGKVIGFDDNNYPIIEINQTPAAYEDKIGTIITYKNYTFLWRKISFNEVFQ